MTSSLALTKRKEMGNVWNIKNFSYPGEDSLGGWEDHYIKDGANGECHPNYYAIPIGNPYGFMVCVKRKGDAGKTLDVPQHEIDPSVWNGYNKYMADLYRPWRDTAIQMYDPYYYFDRRAPYEAQHIQNDMLRLPMAYNGTGVSPIHTPGKPPEKTRFFEYGYSYATQPPYKYDTTRQQQPYPTWKNTQEFHYPQTHGTYGPPYPDLDKLDTEYTRHNPGW